MTGGTGELCWIIPFRRADAHNWTWTSGILPANCIAGITMFRASYTHTHTHDLADGQTQMWTVFTQCTKDVIRGTHTLLYCSTVYHPDGRDHKPPELAVDCCIHSCNISLQTHHTYKQERTDTLQCGRCFGHNLQFNFWLGVVSPVWGRDGCWELEMDHLSSWVVTSYRLPL